MQVIMRVSCALFVLLLAGCGAGDMLGWTTKRLNPPELSAKLSPNYQIYKPEADVGPVPTALLFSGCDGPKDNLEAFAEQFVKQGWAAVVVDSHTPRGLQALQKWRLVCAAQLLPGEERAGDVAVAISDVRNMDFVKDDELVLVGASHGGWAILDMLALQNAGELPFNLKRWPEGFQNSVVPGVRAAVLLYPYCGALSQVGKHGWSQSFPMLFILVEDDTIVEETDCLRVIQDMEAFDHPVSIFMFQGVTHGFDQEEKAALSRLKYSDEGRDQAIKITRAFLEENLNE